jgi:hypothetical protein
MDRVSVVCLRNHQSPAGRNAVPLAHLPARAACRPPRARAWGRPHGCAHPPAPCCCASVACVAPSARWPCPTQLSPPGWRMSRTAAAPHILDCVAAASHPASFRAEFRTEVRRQARSSRTRWGRRRVSHDVGEMTFQEVVGAATSMRRLCTCGDVIPSAWARFVRYTIAMRHPCAYDRIVPSHALTCQEVCQEVGDGCSEDEAGFGCVGVGRPVVDRRSLRFHIYDHLKCRARLELPGRTTVRPQPQPHGHPHVHALSGRRR